MVRQVVRARFVFTHAPKVSLRRHDDDGGGEGEGDSHEHGGLDGQDVTRRR